MAAARAGIGVMSIATPSLSAKIVGYPAAHDNPTARMMARLFGVRELLLAYLVIDAVRGPDGPSPSVFAVQAAVDASDIVVQSWPLLQTRGPRPRCRRRHRARGGRRPCVGPPRTGGRHTVLVS